MRRFTPAALLCLLLAWPAGAQVVSEWRSVQGIPVVVVETPGGDIEHLALVTAPTDHLPDRVLGYAASTSALRGGQLWSLSVPALLTVVALDQIGPVVGPAGLAAFVALGPVPARELRGRLAALDSLPLYPLPRPTCVVADGAEDVVRGSPEQVELRFAAHGAAAARPELLAALAAWLQLRLTRPFAGLRATVEVAGGCPRLVVVAPTSDEPRVTLERLRETLQELVLRPPTAEEASDVSAVLQRRAVGWAGDGAATAAEVAERTAFSFSAASALTPPLVSAAVLEESVRSVLAGHAGAARVVERELRSPPPTGETLDNGVTVTWRWIPGDVAAVAIALGGLQPGAARAAGQAVATAAAKAGWTVTVADILGARVVAAALPASDVAAFMERAAGALVAFSPPEPDELDGAAGAALGLTTTLRAESTVIAMDLPLTVDDAAEIVAKFFGGLSAGAVSAVTPSSGAMLDWTETAGPARMLAVAELPSSGAGVVAGEVLSHRLGAAGLTTSWLAAPGRPVLLVEGSGSADVPTLDSALAAVWGGSRAQVSEEQLREAERSLGKSLYGDMLRAVARHAAGQLLPYLPAPEALLGTEAAEVSAALAELPSWANLRRFARGPAPEAPTPPAPRGVRKSPPRRTRRR